MSELIKVNVDMQTVSARDLYEKLNIETPFKKWIDRMCEYGFEEDKDFWTKMSESTGGRPSREYAGFGYTKLKTHNYLDDMGVQHSKQHMYWTQKRRIFLYGFLKEKGIIPLIESQYIA